MAKQIKNEYDGKDNDGIKEIRVRKVLVFWSKAEAGIARRKREEILEKAVYFMKSFKEKGVFF